MYEQQGAVSLKSGIINAWNRFIASDPGFTRLHLAVSGALNVATTLGVEYVIAMMAHADPKSSMIMMMLGSVIAMIGTMALNGPKVRPKVHTAIFFPVAIGSGVLLSIVVEGHTYLMLGMFVVIMYTAAAIRRFGVSFNFYGFMGWMGYFFGMLTHITLKTFPNILLAVIAASAWILFLSITILKVKPERAIHHTVLAFDARARSVIKICAELLSSKEESEQNKLLRKLHAQRIQLSETALMAEGWSAEPESRPLNQSAQSLRRSLVDAQHVIERFADSAKVLADNRKERSFAAEIAEKLVIHDDNGASRAAHSMLDSVKQRKKLSKKENSSILLDSIVFPRAALEFIDITKQISASAHPGKAAEKESKNEFEPIAGLAMGSLPGSPAVAKEVPAKGRHWNPLARLDFTNRQAIQVAAACVLAILFGRMISPSRYYWAVIAAFIMFTGTSTRSETFLKGFHRFLGTLIGLIISIGLAELTAGHPVLVLVVIVASIFFALYFSRVSYVYMIFFITIIMGQLYSILHEFSTGLLVLRLKETAIGAASGYLVALTVLPLSTKDTLRVTRNRFLESLSELLSYAADRLESPGDEDSMKTDELIRQLDNHLRQIALISSPLKQPLVWGQSPKVHHRLTLYSAITSKARELVIALRNPPDRDTQELVSACRTLGDAAKQFADSPKDKTDEKANQLLNEIDFSILTQADGKLKNPSIIRNLIYLKELLKEVISPSSVDPL